jgi:hypothetical protein
LGRDAKELSAVPPDGTVLANEANVDLVDEGSGLKGMARSFPPQKRGRAAMKLLIDERHELITRLGVSISPGAEQRRHVRPAHLRYPPVTS